MTFDAWLHVHTSTKSPFDVAKMVSQFHNFTVLRFLFPILVCLFFQGLLICTCGYTKLVEQPEVGAEFSNLQLLVSMFWNITQLEDAK